MFGQQAGRGQDNAEDLQVAHNCLQGLDLFDFIFLPFHHWGC